MTLQFARGDHLQASGALPPLDVPAEGKSRPSHQLSRRARAFVANHRKHSPTNQPRPRPTHHPCSLSRPETLFLMSPSHAMEPPAKRMRILQSVEVDEENPDYIEAKQKQARKFKGTLEALFEKYGNMHESMSDEIDMKSNSVVVDRGHLRRLKRRVGRNETLLLDTLGLAAGDEPGEGSEEEEGGGDSEDELAPTQPVKSNSGRAEGDTKRQHTETRENGAQPPPSENTPTIIPNTPSTSIAQFGVPQVPNTPNPAANLLQLVQFPQTPAGQQAQAAFCATLTQSINQAVYQAVVPLFSGLLPPNVQLPFANAPLVPTTPVTTGDKIAPATDPKWFFPPLSAEARKHAVAQSSPLATHTAVSAAEKAVAQRDGNTMAQKPVELPEGSLSMLPTLNHGSPTRPRRSSPRVEIQKRRIGPGKNYHFTAADEMCISRERRIHQTSWAAIRDSKPKWKAWPLGAFHNLWTHLQHKNLHFTESLVGRPGHGVQAINNSSIERVPESPARSHHLPTPSSLEQEDSQREVTESREEEPIDNGLPPSAHFDDDERELLSLAGDDVDDEHLPIPDDEAPLDLSLDDVIPSIETRDLFEEDELYEDSPMRDATLTPVQPIKPEPTQPSTQKRRRLSLDFGVIPDSDEEDDSDAEPTNTTGVSFIRTICQKPFKNAMNLARHQANPRNTHTHKRKSASLDLVGDDELTTPHIKRETSTPPASFFSFETPKPIPRHLGFGSSGSKSTSKVNRKTYLKQVKQSWTRGATPAKRKSMGSLLVRKRAWSGGDGSEDELAL
jgi:hypothetical protein